MSHIRLALVAVCAVDALLGLPLTFTSGALLWARQQNYRLFDVTVGGNLADPSLLAYGSNTDQSGQIAFATDLTAMYTVGYNNKVFRHMAGSEFGQTVATLPTSNSARGIIVAPDGRIYVAAHNTTSATNGRVYDVTSGTPVLFASGLSRPRNMLWTPAGILVAEQTGNQVMSLGAGGVKTVFATGLNAPLDIQAFKGKIYVTTSDGVYDITAGGAITAANRVAWGHSFIGLAATRTALYATTWTASPKIFDITNGGDFTSAAAWGYNLPAWGDTMFDAVPYLAGSEPEPEPEPPPSGTATPEGTTVNFVLGGLMLLLGCRGKLIRS